MFFVMVLCAEGAQVALKVSIVSACSDVCGMTRILAVERYWFIALYPSFDFPLAAIVVALEGCLALTFPVWSEQPDDA